MATVSTIQFGSKGRRIVFEDATIGVPDGIFTVQDGAKKYRVAINGDLSAEMCGINDDATDQTANLQAALNNANVKSIVFNNPKGANYIVSGALDLNGKTISFKPNCKLTGAGTITNGMIDAGCHEVFSNTLTVTNVEPLDGIHKPEWFGAKGDWNDVAGTDDSTAFQKCLNNAVNSKGGNLVLRPGRKYLINSQVTFPRFTNSYVPQLHIIGYGASIVTTAGITIFKKAVIDQADADNQINGRIIIKGIRFEGSSIAGQKALDIQATYGTFIEHCSFIGLVDSINLQFCLKGYVTDCFFQNNSGYDIQLIDGTGNWAGANESNSQSNHSICYHNRHYCKLNQPAAVRIKNTSNVKIEDCIFEGANPQKNIDFYSLGATTVKYFFVDNCHIENQPSICGIDLTVNGTTTIVKSYWSQTAHVFIRRSDGGNNAAVIVDNLVYSPSANDIFSCHNNKKGQTWWSFVNLNENNFAPLSTFWTRYFVEDATYGIPFYKNFTTDSGTNDTINTIGISTFGSHATFNGFLRTMGDTYHDNYVYQRVGDHWFYKNLLLGFGVDDPGGQRFYIRKHAGTLKLESDGATKIGMQMNLTGQTAFPANVDTVTLNADGNRAVASDTIIEYILIKPAADLLSLKIGTSAGGEELQLDSDYTGGTWNVIPVSNGYFEAAGSIYFTGITSATEIKIIKKPLSV